jgi:hypothetical protein
MQLLTFALFLFSFFVEGIFETAIGCVRVLAPSNQGKKESAQTLGSPFE